MPVAPRETDIFRPGDLLNNTYRIEGVLGRGGISEVYRARSEVSGRVLALKVLNKDYAANEAFLVLMTREEEIQDIRHDAIVRYGGCQRTPEGHVYLIMDFVDGVPLDVAMYPDGMEMRDLLVIGARIASGLEATHAKNIIHRDLSPDNIILRAKDPGQAVIIDFGIAKDATPGAETIVGGRFAGKYAYAAPEQFRGQTDPRSDIYATGALLLAAFQGREPAVSDLPAEVIDYKRTALDTSAVPEPLRGVLDRMVVPDLETRFQTAAEMRAAFDQALESLTVVKTLPPVEAPSGGSRWPMLLAGLIGVAALAGGGAFLAERQGLFLPEVARYTLTATREAGRPVTLAGTLPLGDASERIAAGFGGTTSDLDLARGPDASNWSAALESLGQSLAPLDSFTLNADGPFIQLSGEARSPTQRAALETALAALSTSLEIDATLTLPPDRLFAETLQPVLEGAATCGPLVATNLTEAGLPEGQMLRVAGRIEGDADRLSLRDALVPLLGKRPLELDLEPLNASLCLLFRALPALPDSQIGVSYRFGRTGQENSSDRFFPGENAVIDLTLPAEVTEGAIDVVFVQADGSVVRLLPMDGRPDNSVAGLRQGEDGPVTVRVTYPITEASAERPAITVQPPSSTDLVLVVHSAGAGLPAPLRRSESVGAFAAAVKGAADGILGATHRRFVVGSP